LENKRILIVTSAFFPEISPRSFRATELAKEFSRQGNQVNVITKNREYDYSGFLSQFPITLRMWEKHFLKPVRVYKKWPFSTISRIFSRFLSLLLEYPVIEEMYRVKQMLKNEKGYELLISVAVPYVIHWGVAWSRTRQNNIADTWVADCGDPYMGNRLDTYRKPFYFSFLEKWFCRKADFISIPVESAKPAYYKEFHHKIRIIPQGFDFKADSLNTRRTSNEIPAFAYAGGFLKGIRDPELLMSCLLDIKIPFRFYVFTNEQQLLDKYVKVLEEKLIVSGYIPRDELMTRLNKMDFLLNFDNNTDLNIPSKLIDYAIIGRPVLNIDRKFRCESLRSFLEGDYTGKMILPEPQKYHIRNITKQFLELHVSDRQ